MTLLIERVVKHQQRLPLEFDTGLTHERGEVLGQILTDGLAFCGLYLGHGRHVDAHGGILLGQPLQGVGQLLVIADQIIGDPRHFFGFFLEDKDPIEFGNAIGLSIKHAVADGQLRARRALVGSGLSGIAQVAASRENQRQCHRHDANPG